MWSARGKRQIKQESHRYQYKDPTAVAVRMPHPVTVRIPHRCHCQDASFAVTTQD